jgi:hypothetical protein
MENKATQVEVSQEETKVLEEAKVKAEQARVKVEKNKKNAKEIPVEIVGLSQVEAQALNTVLHHIETTKHTPKAQEERILTQLKTIEEDLDLFTHIEQELGTYNNTTHTYRDVVKRIENITKYRDYMESQLEPVQQTIRFADEIIAKINTHIHEDVIGEEKVIITYDAEYILPMLDLAYVIFDLAPTQNGEVELKLKTKE